ncbi:MAG: YicC/YloC family endoribonuclease [Bacteroidota bacterium]
MIKSMTGYGKAVCEMPGKKITIEIRSVNGKQFDIKTRIPSFYSEKELEIRNLLSEKLERGSVDFSMYADVSDEHTSQTLNKKLILSYYNELKSLHDEMPGSTQPDYLSSILRFPDVLKSAREELTEQEWGKVFCQILEAVKHFNVSRSNEGKKLEADITARCKQVSKLLESILLLEENRKENIRTRIKKSLTDISENTRIDENRFEQEIIYYLERIDFTEEKVRLASHLKYFDETMKSEGPIGKKLGFILQEMLRETNTLGSKANDAEIQKIIVQMKDELEKVREQLMNVL